MTTSTNAEPLVATPSDTQRLNALASQPRPAQMVIDGIITDVTVYAVAVVPGMDLRSALDALVMEQSRNVPDADGVH